MRKNYNSNLLYSNDELQKQKIEAIKELNKTTNELRIMKKKKILTIFLILFIVITVTKVFFGTIELNNILGIFQKMLDIIK